MTLEISNCQKWTIFFEILIFLDLQFVTKNMKRRLKFFFHIDLVSSLVRFG
jgi:hypothetical protein